tara:strand:+ start:133 stop:543 length:411 start_codon:yes stop_codon:yes gene_type:complete
MEEYKFIKSKGEKTMEQVNYIEMLQEHFKDAKDYFNKNTKIEMKKLGFSDSTWHQELTPSYLLCDDKANVQIRVWFPNSVKIDDDMNFTKYSITFVNEHEKIWDDEIFTSKELSEILGFIKSNIELFNQLINKESK